MTKLFENFFEIVRPFMVIFAPIVILGLLSYLLKILHPDYYRLGFFSHTVCMKMRRRRKAYWRLMKYKRECRRKAKHNILFRKENSYLLEFMQKH